MQFCFKNPKIQTLLDSAVQACPCGKTHTLETTACVIDENAVKNTSVIRIPRSSATKTPKNLPPLCRFIKKRSVLSFRETHMPRKCRPNVGNALLLKKGRISW